MTIAHESPPVLLLLFNRPAVARQMMEAVRAGQPRQLFVAADGPRPDHPQDAHLCEETRAVVDEVDWPCDVQRLWRDSNLGLRVAVTEAVDWLFEHVEAGVILEDDCLPSPEFLPFAGEVLDRYAGDERVMHVSGLNMRPGERFGDASYHFAGVGHVWGWATWRRAWRFNDPSMSEWPEIRHRYGRRGTPLERALAHKCDSAFEGRKYSWPRVWYYTILRRSGMAVVPSVNMIRNIGFGADATHTKRSWRHPLRVREHGGLRFPLEHPAEVAPDPGYERRLARYHRGSYRDQLLDLCHALLTALRGGRLSPGPEVGGSRNR